MVGGFADLTGLRSVHSQRMAASNAPDRMLWMPWMVLLAMGLQMCGRQPDSLQAFSKRTWLFLILSGLATGLSWLCYFHALQAGPASRVAPIDKLSVVLVILFAAAFLGERLTWGKGVGGLLIVAGAVVIALD